MQSLLNILAREEEVLKKMLQVSVDKQTALVSNSREKLDECTRIEEALLPRIKTLENERLTEYKNLREKYNLTVTNNRLEEYLENLKPEISEEDYDKLHEIQLEIKQVVTDLRKLNEQNMYLINHSRSFIGETISILAGEGKKSILDRKV